MPQPYVTPKQLSEINKINEASEEIVAEAEQSGGSINFYTIDISDLSFNETDEMELPDADKLLEAIQNGNLIKVRYDSKAEEGIAPDLGFLNLMDNYFTYTETIFDQNMEENLIIEVIVGSIVKFKNEYQILETPSSGGRTYYLVLELDEDTPHLYYSYYEEE